MRRRTFLGSLGLAGSIGVVVADRSKRAAPLEVAVWFSERAAGYGGLRSRVEGYLERALSAAGVEVRLAISDRSIPLEEEQGARLLTVEWPRLVLGGALGLGGKSVRTTGDVNLLITDGDPTSRPAGYGMNAVAAMTGARLLAEMPLPEETAPVVPPTGPAVITQLLLHECGHALGLAHTHGTVYLDGDAVVATPMIGRYAWAAAHVRRRQIGRDGDRCGSTYPEVTGRRRRLRLGYGPCASLAIRDRFESGRRWTYGSGRR